jgi:hypothetical protein
VVEADVVGSTKHDDDVSANLERVKLAGGAVKQQDAEVYWKALGIEECLYLRS